MQDSKYPYKILFIEDEQAIRDNYTRYLKRHFEYVFEARDGEEAYRMYNDKKPHILIIDINIPKFNGIELLKKIRKNDHTTKAIMLTAHSDTNYLLEAAELKLTKYMIKPISRDELKNGLKLVIHELSMFDTLSKKVLKLRDGYVWEYERCQLLINGSSVLITNKERKILTLLFDNVNKAVTYDEIIFSVWYDYEEGRIDALKTIIKNLRKKLPNDTIKNIYGSGYKVDIR